MGQPLNGTAGPPMGLQMCASAMPPPHFPATSVELLQRGEARRGGQKEGGLCSYIASSLPVS